MLLCSGNYEEIINNEELKSTKLYVFLYLACACNKEIDFRNHSAFKK